VDDKPIGEVEGGFASGKKERDLIPKNLPAPESKRTDTAWNELPNRLRWTRVHGPELVKKVAEAFFDLTDIADMARDPQIRGNKPQIESLNQRLEKTTWQVESARDSLDRVAAELKATAKTVPLPEKDKGYGGVTRKGRR